MNRSRSYRRRFNMIASLRISPFHSQSPCSKTSPPVWLLEWEWNSSRMELWEWISSTPALLPTTNLSSRVSPVPCSSITTSVARLQALLDRIIMCPMSPLSHCTTWTTPPQAFPLSVGPCLRPARRTPCSAKTVV